MYGWILETRWIRTEANEVSFEKRRMYKGCIVQRAVDWDAFWWTILMTSDLINERWSCPLDYKVLINLTVRFKFYFPIKKWLHRLASKLDLLLYIDCSICSPTEYRQIKHKLYTELKPYLPKLASLVFLWIKLRRHDPLPYQHFSCNMLSLDSTSWSWCEIFISFNKITLKPSINFHVRF